MRRLPTAVALLAATTFAPAAFASTEFSVAPDCGVTCQSAFEGAVEDISAALNYKALAPAESTGLLGFGIGAFVNYTPVENKSDWKQLTGTNVDFVGMAGVVVSKGLPFGFDVGAFYTAVPDTSVSAFGAELRYAILEGGVAEPALAVRGAYTATSGIDDFDYEAYSVDMALSKGFTFLTPYIGAGYVWSTATPQGTVTEAPFNLRKVDVDHERIYVGLRVTLAILELTPEYERQGDNNGYSLRLGFSF
ncbi:hypothetical protein E4T66_13165 [Sinimarinibacterium sp. CAU 1509]|uniref:DUF6588 family protein n=1 Tax=Sinimarinibacterium sp. CAU 1509 TaxID=2562283 RepID=UPI0010ABF408|nr:DUF6588 family protein [Sinimarinibacterium sp. CAU 1509]TJY59343.1 hypothetical protein E4T66_13165 [Sinimarinibacterium sp. CAU 1509]